MVRAYGIFGMKPHEERRLAHFIETAEEREEYSLSVDWERAWSVGCSLRVGFRHETETYDGKKIRRAYPTVEVSWSSTGRSVAAARASVALYAQVTDLAALVETFLGEGVWGEVRS
jgi:hypothetical protein